MYVFLNQFTNRQKKMSHPCGVLPSGNFFFASDNLQKRRFFGLGRLLNRLSDEQILSILPFCDVSSLLKLMQTSKALYIYCQTDDLWRDLVLHKVLCVQKFTTNWKTTYKCIKLGSSGGEVEKDVIIFNGIYSDYMHRPWYCSQFDISKNCPGFYEFDDIERVKAEDMSVEQFVHNFEIPNRPVVIQNAVKGWSAFEQWTDDYLVSVCKDSQFRATSATAALSASFTMSSYFQYASQTQGEEVPLYLFERDFASLVPELETAYSVPPYFSYSASHGSDLFQALGSQARPDYRWLIVGPARSGSIFHVDPNQTNAWNVSIRGRKKWIFYPPDVSPPGVAASVDGAEVAVPISTGEWMLSFWKFHLEARAHPDVSKRPLEAVLNPGEVIYYLSELQPSTHILSHTNYLQGNDHCPLLHSSFD